MGRAAPTATMRSVTVLLAVVGLAGVSASGPLMAATQAPALTIAFWRNALAAGVLAPVAAVSRRAELASMSSREVALVTVSGGALALHFATWVSSLKLTSVASATALVCTQVGWVVLLGRMRGRRVSRAVIVGLGVSFAGVLVVSGVDVTISTRALGGDALALAGGLFAAAYTDLGASARRSLSTTTYTTLCYGTCALLLLPAAVLAGQPLTGFSTQTWAGIIAVTVAAQLLGHSVFNHLLAVVSPTVVSLVLLLEVPGAALLAAVFLGETPPAGLYLGLLLILSGLAVVVTHPTPGPAPQALD
jgi:drug/metabolite transporter (DMT)-like permease